MWSSKPPYPQAPKWHGFASNAPDLYAQFVRKVKEEQRETEPLRLRRQISDYESSVIFRRQELAEDQRIRDAITADVAVLRKLVDSPPTDEDIEAEFARLIEHPAVLGTRTDAMGLPYIQFRVTYTEEDSTYDLGDYELGLVKESYSRRYIVNMIRKPSELNMWAPFGSADCQQVDYYYRSSLPLPAHYLRMGWFVKLTGEAIDRITQNVRDGQYSLERLRIEGELPEVIWEGVILNPLKAFKRALDRLKDSPEILLRSKEVELRDCEERIERRTQQIRNLQRSLRETRAELKKAEEVRKTGVVEFDRAQAHADYEYIKSLPGVMGIRFDPDGIPIIHVRTAYVHEGTRFDLGDLEIYLTKNGRNEAYGVVKVRATRWSKRGGVYLSYPGTGRDWFCFGTRQHELSEHFDAGAIREFLHLAIHSLNSINEHHKVSRTLSEYYDEIPMDAVWEDRPKPARPRRRRHWQSEEARVAIV